MGMGAGGVDKIGTMPGLGHGHGHGKGEAEGMHVCVTCGRTDSPEWRKGPLGPKTLCNVSFLWFLVGADGGWGVRYRGQCDGVVIAHGF